MSLNGLDKSAVVEAHQSTLTDQGGWFLLKYVTRDTVDLLEKGSGGVPEARAAVERYEEKSPLYGLVQYRRKRVILKYVPEGTSRLLQVRLAVQFQSVLDSLIPHDTVFSFTASTELTDNALGQCTMSLQEPASQTSSTSSLRHRRLNDITEGEEDPPAIHRPDQAQNEIPQEKAIPADRENDELPRSTLKASMLSAQLSGQPGIDSKDEIVSKPKDSDRMLQSYDSNFPSHKEPLPERSMSRDKALPATPQSSRPPTTSNPPVERPTTALSHYSKTHLTTDIDESPAFLVDKDALDYLNSQHLSPAESSSISRWTEDVLASTYPLPRATKKKLGPRPHVEAPSRPRTSGASDEVPVTKRVANLPNSIRVQSRPPTSMSQARPPSAQSSRSVPGRFVPSNSLPPPMPSPALRPQQPQSLFKSSVSVVSSTMTEMSSATPEKLRLMKALQMRKRNQILSSRPQTSPQSNTPTTSPDKKADINSVIAPSLRQTHLEDNQKTVVKAVNSSEGVQSMKSSQATPTSAVTISEKSSTKPSSVSDSYNRKPSLSLSSATNSSNTPKAENSQREPVLPEVNSSNAALSRSTEKVQERPSTPVISPAVDSLPQSTSYDVPSKTSLRERPETPEQPVEEEEQIYHGSLLSPSRMKKAETKEEKRVIKRNVFRGSIRIPNEAELSENSDDDSFLDELQNATVQEAKPVSVARSPFTPVIAKTTTSQVPKSARSVTSPVSLHTNDSQSTPDDKRSGSRAGSTRSTSTALPAWPPPETEPMPTIPKQKLTVGSSISKRIKALEGLSNRDSVAPPPRDSPQRTSTLTSLVRKSAFISPSQVDIATRPQSSASRSTTIASNYDEPGETKHSSRIWGFGHSSKSESTASRRSESVSLAARLMGARHNTSDKNSSRNEPLPASRRVNLKGNQAQNEDGVRSNEHRRGVSATSMESGAKSTTSSRRRFSLSSHKSSSTARLPNSESVSGRKSFTASFRKLPKPSDVLSINDDKKTSVTGRMFKRLSGMSNKRSHDSKDMSMSPGKDTSIHETIVEGSVLGIDSSVDLSILQFVEIGDVNVQFPESLLWKRRSLRIDDQGFLIFAPPANDLNLRSRTRKFHLSEFQSPSLPDREREQMAWSILLDLREGGCIQCACENKQSQETVLKMLVDAHSAYEQLYG